MVTNQSQVGICSASNMALDVLKANNQNRDDIMIESGQALDDQLDKEENLTSEMGRCLASSQCCSGQQLPLTL